MPSFSTWSLILFTLFSTTLLAQTNPPDADDAKEAASFGSLHWKFKTGGKIFSSPAIWQGTAFIGSEDKNLYAIDARNGTMRWKFTTGGAVHSSPLVFNNTVYFGSYDGYYYALDAGSGRLIWKFRTEGEKRVGATGLWTMKPHDQYMEDLYDFFLSSPVIDKDDKSPTLYFGSSDGNCYALHAGDGSLKWKFRTRGLIHASPILYKGKVFVGSWDTWFYALDAHSGKEIWKFKTGEQPVYHVLQGIQSAPTPYKGMVCFGARDGYFYALNARTGHLKWKYAAGNSWVLTTAAARDGILYIGTSDSYLFLALDASTGKELYHLRASGYIYSSPVLAGRTAFFGDFTGQLFAVDLNSMGKSWDVFATDGHKKNGGRILTPDGNLDFAYAAKGMDPSLYTTNVTVMNRFYELGSIVSTPAVAGGAVYFGSADGNLYSLGLTYR